MLNIRSLITTLFVILHLSGLMIAQSGEEPSKRLRVVTYNIASANNVDRETEINKISQLISQVNPDLVAFQGIENSLQRSGDELLIKYIAEKVGFNMAAIQPYENQEPKNRIGILSRYPIRQKATMRIADDNDGSPRYLLGVEITHPVIGAITFGSVEIDDAPDTDNPVLQAQAINRAFQDDTRNKAMIACTIFAKPKSKTVKALRENWEDASKDYEQLTYPASNPSIKADYIFLKKNSPWRVLASRIMYTININDHLPLVLDLEWTE